MLQHIPSARSVLGYAGDMLKHNLRDFALSHRIATLRRKGSACRSHACALLGGVAAKRI